MNETAIAIIGMAGRFPRARNLEEFWKNLRDGVESIRPFSDEELLAAGARPEDLANPDYVKSGTTLEDLAMFDAPFFGLSPKDAAIMDPQHRHFLECAWEAMENSGHVPESFAGSIGVYGGSGLSAYMIHNLLNNRRLLESAGLFLIRQTGNDKDVLATRVSYQFNLHGPSVSVQTACSTSLVAVHMACQSLLNQECDMALAGGVTIEIPHGQGYIYREGEILSRDGHCRAFDAASSGTVFSSGAGVVVLRRLSDALEDGDTIHAVILGTAINNDGSRKVGYLAPSVDGQAEVIAEALGVAGVNANDISYVETHGTGTAVGDPIEIKALTQAFRESTDRKGFCGIGSLKTNIGHLDTAAGVSGLIKTVLALKHRQIPPSLHFENPNPLIDFQSSPFFVNAKLADWKTNGLPRRAGVTSLGIGGTNAHVVLEEAPSAPVSGTAKSCQLIPISARTAPAAKQSAANLAAYLRQNPNLNFADVAFTLQAGRKGFAHRRFVVANDVADAAEALAATDSKRVFSGTAAAAPPSVVFMFSGQGSQYVNMGRELYEQETVFRAEIDACANALLPHLGLDLRKLLFAPEEQAQAATEQLNQTRMTQPALFAIEYSLSQWWMKHGITPKAMLGHSIGEYVAACLAGVISFEDALAVTAVRGRLMQEMAAGSMLAVSLPANELSLPAALSLAAVNSPELCVVSGPTDAVEEFATALAANGTNCRKLFTSHAFHSVMMEPMLDQFRSFLQGIQLHAPVIPYVSNLTGTWITAEQATDPDYWTKHLRHTVRFSDCLAELYREPGQILLEVGPGQVLASLARQHPEKNAKVFSSLRHPQEKTSDVIFLLNTVGQLWTAGCSLDWQKLHAGRRARRIPLPTYPFEHQRYWIEPDARAVLSEQKTPDAQADPLSGLFHRRVWEKASLPTDTSSSPAKFLVFADEAGLGPAVVRQLQAADHDVIGVRAGDAFRRQGTNSYRIRPGFRNDYDELLTDILKSGNPPQKIIHIWPAASDGNLNATLDASFYSLLFLAQALGDRDSTNVDITAISNQLQSVAGERASHPACATLAGPVKVIPKEFPNATCRSVDVDLKSGKLDQIASQIIAETLSHKDDPAVAYRGDQRWVEKLVPADPPAKLTPRLKTKGVYLITGGLGGIGLVIAEHLAKQWQARLVLLGRTELPPQSEWGSIAKDQHHRHAATIRKLIEFQVAGAQVLCVSTDVTSLDAVKNALEAAEKTFGRIDGVIHAAGVIEDTPLQLKSRESAARVLAPKVQGTLVLTELLKDRKPDFFVLFSSISAVLPPAGQVDYAAANAFLDAFATSVPNVISVNWGRWNVGMGGEGQPAHPLLDRTIVTSPDEMVYEGQFNCDRFWLLSEHRLKNGKALVPGTGYLELATAAMSRGSFGSGFVLEDVFFVSPMMFAASESKEVRVQLRRDHSAFRFSILANDGGWSEYATGRISRNLQDAPRLANLDEIRRRCNFRIINFDDAHRTRQESYFDFGPRWRNLKRISIGKDEGLSELELREDFRADLDHYSLHPALLDLATGSALYLIGDYEKSTSLYLPFSYKRIRAFKPLRAKMWSHIRSHQGNNAQRDIATFDFTLMDERGDILAEIEEFSVRRLTEAPAVAAAVRPAVAISAQTAGTKWIEPAKGVEALARILAGPIVSTIMVAPSEATISKAVAAKAEAVHAAGSMDEVETVLAGWWQELLGVEQVGLDDDFFDLGGQSLVAVRLFSKIRKTYDVDLGLSVLFEHRTIRQLSERIQPAQTSAPQPAPASSAIVPIRPSGKRVPLFLISGLGGNVLNFHSLSRHLGEDQPVYALQPQGLDGKKPFLTRVEDMAEYYIREIKQLQPEGPYYLAGYSFGGFVAYEMAQQISASGGRVGLLGLLDTIEWHYLERIKSTLRLQDRFTLYKSRIDHILFGEDRYDYVRERLNALALKYLYVFYKTVGRPVPQTVGSITDINTFAAANYKPRPYAGTLTIFRSVKREALDGDDELLGWGGLAAGGYEVHDVPGTHHDMTQEPNVRILAEEVRKCLNRATEVNVVLRTSLNQSGASESEDSMVTLER